MQKTKIVYIVICITLLVTTSLLAYNNYNLKQQVSFWQQAHTSLSRYWLDRETAWQVERIQWAEATESRDAIITWWASKPPETIEKIVEIPVEIEVIKEIQVVQEVEKTVCPQRFTDVDAAKEWVLSHKLPVVIIADRPNNLVSPKHDPRYDCDDYADDYEALALSENISLWQAPVTNVCIWGVRVAEGSGNHVGMWTKIGNAYYYIEPQPIDDKWRFIKIMDAD
jgi:hypothetical protein